MLAVIATVSDNSANSIQNPCFHMLLTRKHFQYCFALYSQVNFFTDIFANLLCNQLC